MHRFLLFFLFLCTCAWFVVGAYWSVCRVHHLCASQPTQEQEVVVVKVPEKALSAPERSEALYTCTDGQIITSTLRKGDTGDDVVHLEEFLAEHDYTVLKDGTLSADDVTAVEKFQRDYADDVLTPVGLTAPSGIVGSSTRAKINELACAASNTQ